MESRKQEIIREAARLFRKQGYKETSMQDIADEIGIKAASLYNHISSKHEILEDLLLNAGQAFVDGMEEIISAQLSPTKKMERIIALHVRLTIENPNQMAMITQDWRALNAESKQEFLSMRDSYDKDFRQILNDGIHCGEFSVNDLDVAVFSILSTLRWFFVWYLANEDRSTLELELELQSVLLRGIIK